MCQYEVKTVSEHHYEFAATTAQQAKAIVCREIGKKVSDYWFGARTMHARRIGNENT